MALIQLIYVSAARKEFDVAELDRILESASRHNTPQDITGMLLYAAGSFMQVLEGEADAVDETYGRITADPRHHDIFLITREPNEQRNFAQWRMGFRRLGANEAATHPAFAPLFKYGFDAESIKAQPGLALNLLKEFGSRQRG